MLSHGLTSNGQELHYCYDSSRIMTIGIMGDDTGTGRLKEKVSTSHLTTKHRNINMSPEINDSQFTLGT